MEDRDRPFLPGAGKTWLLPFYDAFTRVAGIRALHERAVELAGIEPGQTVIDVGCGTGDLSVAVLAAKPSAGVTGLDPTKTPRAGQRAGRAAAASLLPSFRDMPTGSLRMTPRSTTWSPR